MNIMLMGFEKLYARTFVQNINYLSPSALHVPSADLQPGSDSDESDWSTVGGGQGTSSDPVKYKP